MTEIKEARSGDRPGGWETAAPWRGPLRGWIFYDGNCRYCIASAETFAGCFGRRGFQFLALQTPWVMRRLGLEPNAPLEEMRVLTHDGRDLGGVNALLFLAKQIWWAWPVVTLARLPGMHKLLDRGYRWVAAHRGCDHVACEIKERRLPSRRFAKPAVERPPLLEAWTAWLPLILWPVLAVLFRDRLAPWQFMWLMVAAIFFGCKWLTFWKARDQCHPSLPRMLGYLFAWPGMDAGRFLCPHARKNLTASSRQVLGGLPGGVGEARGEGSVPREYEELSGKMSEAAGSLRSGTAYGSERMSALPNERANAAFPIAKILSGALLLFGFARLTNSPILAGWLGMIGMILILHFGMFALLANAWRAYGIDARPIMDAPLKSATLGEFWGRRWNGAFNQLAFEILFRPLARTTGPIIGTIVAFLASGLIHELVISLPARAGYGLPAAYFLLQACGVLVQHRLTSVRRGVAGRFFTILMVAVPAFWLFHPPFVRNVILPFMKAIGAL